MFNVKQLIILSIILSIYRYIPHINNLSPISSIILLYPLINKNKIQNFTTIFCSLFISDLFINNVLYASYNPVFVWFYSGFYWQYGAYVLVILVGIGLFKNNITLPKLVGSAIASSVLFFLISNFGSWLNNPIYTKDLSGLLTCYVAGVPFYQGTLLGDLFYSTILFGTYNIFKNINYIRTVSAFVLTTKSSFK